MNPTPSSHKSETTSDLCLFSHNEPNPYVQTQLLKYIRSSRGEMTGVLKQESSNYELRDGVLYNSELNTPVISILEDLISTIESAHKDLGHYGKRTMLYSVRQRYKVASDLWEEGGKVLDLCVPCQLYKRPCRYRTVLFYSRFLAAEDEDSGPPELESVHRRIRKVDYYITLRKYLKAVTSQATRMSISE
jgi:hypothetical protein